MRVPPEGSPDDWFSWLRGQNQKLRKRATLILGGLEPTDEVAVTPLQDRLADDDADVVFWAIIGLQRLGERALSSAPMVAEIATRHPTFGVRQAAVGALPMVGPTEPCSLLALRAALRDESPFVRREALQAFVGIPNLEARDLETIADMSKDPDEAVAMWSEIALRNISLREREA
jgi:HEAT repeat protein